MSRKRIAKDELETIYNSMIRRLFFALIGLSLSILGAEFLQQLAFQGKNDQESLAVVNEKPITLAQAEIHSMYLFGKNYENINDLERHFMTQILIDEELLIQRGEILKIPNQDIDVRKSLVSAGIRDITSDFEAVPISERTLKRFFSEHQSIFVTPKRVALDVVTLTNDADLRIAKSLIAEGFDLSKTAESLRLNFAIPQGLQTEPIIHRQLGTEMTRAAMKLQNRQISSPIKGSDGVYFIQITAHENAASPAFEEVRDSVIQEYKRRGRELALREKLDRLAIEAGVKTNIISARHK